MKVDSTILLVDDHTMFQESLSRVVKGISGVIKVYGVSSAKEAALLMRKTEVDLVLLDIQMPEKDGIIFLSEIQALPKSPYVIMLTTHDRDDYAAKAIRFGAKGYILKSAPTSELKSAILTVLNGGTHFSSQVQGAVINEMISNNLFTIRNLSFTERELDVLRLICEQQSGKSIADSLGISLSTVGTHRSNLLKKTGCINMVGLVRFAISNGYYRSI